MGAKIFFKLFGGFRGNNFKSLGSQKKIEEKIHQRSQAGFFLKKVSF